MRKILLPSFILCLSILVFGASYYYESHLDNSFQTDLFETRKNIRNDSIIIANAENAIRNHELKDSLLIELESGEYGDENVSRLKDEILRITNELDIAKRESVSSNPIIVNVKDTIVEFFTDSLIKLLDNRTRLLDNQIIHISNLQASLDKAKIALKEAHYKNYIALMERTKSEEARISAEKQIQAMRALQDSLDIEQNEAYQLPALIIYGPFDEDGNKIENDSLEFKVELINKDIEKTSKRKRKRKNKN